MGRDRVVGGKAEGASNNGFVERVWVKDGSEGVGHNSLTTIKRTFGEGEGSNVGVVMGEGGTRSLRKRAGEGEASSGL